MTRCLGVRRPSQNTANETLTCARLLPALPHATTSRRLAPWIFFLISECLLRSNAGSQINFLTLCTMLNRAIRIRKRDYLQILQVISSNPGKVVGPVFLGRSNEKLEATRTSGPRYPPRLSDQNLEVRGEDFPRNRIATFRETE